MTPAVRHTCPVPGCDWHHDHQLRTFDGSCPPGEFVAQVEADHADVEDVVRDHLASHYLPDPDGVGVVDDRPLVDVLTVDGAPAVDLGENVAGLVMLTRCGHVQVIGRTGVPADAMVEALRRAADTLERHA